TEPARAFREAIAKRAEPQTQHGLGKRDTMAILLSKTLGVKPHGISNQHRCASRLEKRVVEQTDFSLASLIAFVYPSDLMTPLGLRLYPGKKPFDFTFDQRKGLIWSHPIRVVNVPILHAMDPVGEPCNQHRPVLDFIKRDDEISSRKIAC